MQARSFVEAAAFRTMGEEREAIDFFVSAEKSLKSDAEGILVNSVVFTARSTSYRHIKPGKRQRSDIRIRDRKNGLLAPA